MTPSDDSKNDGKNDAHRPKETEGAQEKHPSESDVSKAPQGDTAKNATDSLVENSESSAPIQQAAPEDAGQEFESENNEDIDAEEKEDIKPHLKKIETIKRNSKIFIAYLKTKHGKITASSITAFLLISLLMVKACEPAKAGTLYKVCSGFLEQQIQFPETIEHMSAEQYPMGVRIYYTHIDGFGQYLSEYIECSFGQDDPALGLQLVAVVFNTIKEETKKTPVKNKGRLYAVEKQYIDRFNKANSIGSILSQEHEILFPYPEPLFPSQ